MKAKRYKDHVGLMFGDIQIYAHLHTPGFVKVKFQKAHGLFLVVDWILYLGIIEVRKYVAKDKMQERLDFYNEHSR